MNKEKQIEEMAKEICSKCKSDTECKRVVCTMAYREAEYLYDKGYRKQSEWISVDERFPERNGRYLTHCNIEGQSLVCILYYCKIGGFNEGTVTHWMPLPEPQKMKGGAE